MNKSEYDKRLREARKKEQCCIQCGKQDAYTLAGRSRCYECAEAGRKSDRRRQNTERRKAYQKKKVEKWKAEGKCSRCGRQLQTGDGLICRYCKTHLINNNRKRSIEAGMNWPRGANGFCFQCNKEPALEGKRLCAACYERTMKAQKIATVSRDMHGMVWRRYDQAMFDETRRHAAEQEEASA